MKTKQEQIEKMSSIITDCLCKDCVDCKYYNGHFCTEKDTGKAEALMQAGYGDVSEYKTEIERLKAENEQSRKPRILGYEATVEFHDDIVSEPSADCKEKEIKQAKLNILGEMWARISHNKTLIQSHIADGSFTIEDIYMEIDELMAEVQNET